MPWLQWGIEAAERGLIPDAVTRTAIRRLCAVRRRELCRPPDRKQRESQAAFRESLRSGPLTLSAEIANSQHYEAPVDFFGEVLGSRKKYSCCYWPRGTTTLDEAEVAALELTERRADLSDGQEILELGCGWGALTLWLAERQPTSRITAISNSNSQRRYIEELADARGLANVRVVTVDINEFDPVSNPAGPTKFDRVVSIEMFEHVRNYRELFSRVSSWLKPTGKLFTHVFCHRRSAYPFENHGDSDWMARHFFTGGTMPTPLLWREFAGDLRIEREWSWNGEHYRKTATAWLNQLDARRERALAALGDVMGQKTALRALNRWRIFFMAVAELFGFAGGSEWFVHHALFDRAD